MGNRLVRVKIFSLKPLNWNAWKRKLFCFAPRFSLFSTIFLKVLSGGLSYKKRFVTRLFPLKVGISTNLKIFITFFIQFLDICLIKCFYFFVSDPAKKTPANIEKITKFLEQSQIQVAKKIELIDGEFYVELDGLSEILQ